MKNINHADLLERMRELREYENDQMERASFAGVRLDDWTRTYIEIERDRLASATRGLYFANPVPRPVLSGMPGFERAREKWDAYRTKRKGVLFMTSD